MSFSAELSDWARKTEERMTAVLRQSVQDLVAEAQTPVSKGGNMPVDTGFLRNSLKSEILGATAITGADGYLLVAQGIEPGQIAEFTWTAHYAVHVHYGARGRPGRMFAELAAAKWPDIVASNAARAKAGAK